jgi:glycosyltransferase involved in cell wall biosynthesis
MLRVAMITDHAASGDKVDGGVQAVTKYLVGALARLEDIELHVLSFKYGITQSQSREESRYGRYRRYILPGARFGTLTGFRSDQRTLNATLESIQPDLVHGQGAGHNGILASRSRFPSVITIHGIMAEEAKFLAGRGRRARHWLLSEISDRWCIRRGHHTILITPYVADYFRNRLAGEHYLIPNPIADEFFEIERRESPGRVLFAGRLYRLKGVMDLVRATAQVARSRQIDLVLAGSLDDASYVRQLQDEAAQLGIGGQVHFRGLLSEAELRDELAAAAALVLPSYQETAPMVIVEAMAAGVPVIASDVGGVRYLVKDGETGLLIRPGDVDGLAASLGLLLSDPERRGRLGETAKAVATDEYRAASVARQTVAVYRKVVACRTPATQA